METKYRVLIHGMVVFLAGPVLGGVFLPAVLGKLPDGIPAGDRKQQLAAAQQLADPADAVEDLIFGGEDGVDAVTTDTLHKAGG